MNRVEVSTAVFAGEHHLILDVQISGEHKQFFNLRMTMPRDAGTGLHADQLRAIGALLPHCRR